MGNLEKTAMQPRSGKGRFKPTHGIIMFQKKGKLPRVPGARRASRYAEELGHALTLKYGGENITPEAEAVISTIVNVTKINGMISLYLNKAGIIRQDQARRGNIEMHGILARQYIAYLNVLNRSIALLQALDHSREKGPTLAEIITEFDARQGGEGAGEKGE